MTTTTIEGAAQVKSSTITDTQVAAANKDGVAATPSMRTLGTGSQQACSGADARLSATQIGGFALSNGYISATVASNALTIKVLTMAGANPSSGDPVTCQFRESTGGVASSGNIVTTSITAANSFVISSGSTMGQVAAKPFRLWIVGANDGGFTLGAISCTTNNANFSTAPLRDYMITTSTTEGGSGGADSAFVIYSTTGFTNKSIRVLGFLDFDSLTTAGAWASTPSVIQAYMPGVSLPGEIVQSQIFRTNTMQFGSTTVPADDSLPSKTEGDQFLSQDIKPTMKANTLHVHVNAQFHDSTANSIAMSLFIDTGTDAVATTFFANVSLMSGYVMDYYMTAAVVSSMTFKIRAGSNAGGMTMNGFANTHYYGYATGVTNGVTSYLTIDEIMA